MLELLTEYKATPTEELKDRIVRSFAPIARRIAVDTAMRRRTTNRFLDLDDLTNAGLVAVFQNLESFDPCKGVPPLAYFRQKIRFAMLDMMRTTDFLTRTERQKRGAGFSLHSLSGFRSDDENETPLSDSISIINDPAEVFLIEDFWREILRGEDKVPRLMLLMFFRMQMNMNDIAKHFGVTQSGVSLTIKTAIKRIRWWRFRLSTVGSRSPRLFHSRTLKSRRRSMGTTAKDRRS